MTEIDIYGDEDVILLPSPHMAWDDDSKWKADSRLYNAETDAWVKKLSRNRDREVTLSILICDMNDTFGTKAGRTQIQRWRTKAKQAYMAGERRRGIRPNEVVASNVVGHAVAPFSEADEGKICKVRLHTRTSSTGRITQTGWNQAYEATIIRVNKNGTFDAFFPGRPITNRYAEFSSARKIPVIENNPSRHFELFEQYVHDEKHREKAREREKKKMEDELAALRKTLAVYRYKFKNQQRDDTKSWKELQKIADDQYLYYDSTKNEFDMYEEDEAEAAPGAAAPEAPQAAPAQSTDSSSEDDNESTGDNIGQPPVQTDSDSSIDGDDDNAANAAASLTNLGKRKSPYDRGLADGEEALTEIKKRLDKNKGYNREMYANLTAGDTPISRLTGAGAGSSGASSSNRVEQEDNEPQVEEVPPTGGKGVMARKPKKKNVPFYNEDPLIGCTYCHTFKVEPKVCSQDGCQNKVHFSCGIEKCKEDNFTGDEKKRLKKMCKECYLKNKPSNPYVGKKVLYRHGRETKTGRGKRKKIVYDEYVGEVISFDDDGLYTVDFTTKNGKDLEAGDFTCKDDATEVLVKKFIKAYDKMAKKNEKYEPNQY